MFNGVRPKNDDGAVLEESPRSPIPSSRRTPKKRSLNNSFSAWKRPANETYEQRKERMLKPNFENVHRSIDFSKLLQGEGTQETIKSEYSPLKSAP